MATREPLGTLLIADDSKSVRNFLSYLLNNAGYTIITAEDGRQAWQAIARKKIDIINL